MTFARPEMMGLLWLLPLLAGFYGFGQFRRRRLLRRYCDRAHLKTSDAPGTVARRRWKAALVLVAAGCTVVALSGPHGGVRRQAAGPPPADILVALDCSRSMLAADVTPSRLTRAKREARDLLEMLHGERIGLVAFAGSGYLACPLTADHAIWPRFLDGLHPESLPLGGSDFVQALAPVREALAAAEAPVKAVIMITDGEHNGHGDPLDAARALQHEGIRLFCMGVGTREGARVPDGRGGFLKDGAGRSVHSRLDESLLKQMALRTGGSYVRAVAGTEDLEVIYRQRLGVPAAGPVNPASLRPAAAGHHQGWLVLALALLLLERWWPLARRTVGPGALAALLLPLLVMTACGDSRRNGQEAYRRGDYAAALAHFSEAQQRHPQDAAVAFNLGNVHYRMGNFPAARDAYRRALAAGDERLQAEAYYNLGNSSFRMGSYAAAARSYRAALRLDPGDREAQANLGRVRRLLARDASAEGTAAGTRSQKDASRADVGPGARAPSAAPSDRQTPPGRLAFSGGVTAERPSAAGAGARPQGSQEQVRASADDRRAFEALVDRPRAPLWPSAERREVVRDW